MVTTKQKPKPIVDDDINISTSNDTLKQIISDLLPLFRNANTYLLIALSVLFLSDVILLAMSKIDQSSRIIDKNVAMTLIGATAAEISVIIIAAIRKLK